MTSWQAKLSSLLARRMIRSRKWGRDENEVAKRARKKFGSPKFLQKLHTRHLNLQEINDGRIRGEWLEPEDFSPDGVVLYFHGGGFVACSPAKHRPITAALAKKTKFRVFSVDYRRAPEHKFPAALDDCEDAFQWLTDQGIPAEKISLAGDSAGGGLVLSVLLRRREKNLSRPACGVCFSPWTDLKGTGTSMYENDGRCAMFRPENILEFAPAYLGDEPAENFFCSPVFADLNDLPPVLLQVSSTELLLDDSLRVHEKIQAGGGHSELEIYENLMHDWQMMYGFMPEADRALTKSAAFIRQNISRKNQETG